jgi:hypothetical protein
MNKLKARIVILAAAALVGAVIAPTAFTKKGADDPAGHVRHAKKHTKSSARKHATKRRHAGRTSVKGQKGNSASSARGREAEPGDDRGQVAEPADDRGQVAEPGDDRGVQAEPGDDRGQDRQAEAGDDRGGHGNDDGSGHN